MTKSRFMLSVSAMCLAVAIAPAAYAQGMAPAGSTMANPSSDKMTKPDTVGKTDTMAKPADKTDAMKKADDEKKKDGMSGGMAK